MPRVDPADLAGVLAAALGGDAGPLRAFLTAHSHLPGPRGNLELAWQFADAVRGLATSDAADAAWHVAAGLASIGAAEAPTSDPGEFLAFCGTVASAAFAADSARRPAVWEVIRRAAEDPRWRLREAAAQAIQRALPLDPHGTQAVLTGWARDGSWLRCRAVVAGLADPPLLHDEALAAEALALHEVVLARFASAPDRHDPGYRVLRQGLGYTLSVVVAAAPDPGFALLRGLAEKNDRDLAWVLRSNLGKGRLARAHPAEVEAVRSLMGS
jgi:hypothetical protein